jgi:hypothetical protein
MFTLAERKASMSGWTRLAVLLERVTYKPGSRFSVERPPGGPAFLQLKLYVQDVNNPARTTPLCHARPLEDSQLDEMSDAELIKTLVYQSIAEMERHEIHEWLRFDGVPVIDPHPELKDFENNNNYRRPDELSR